MINAGSRDSNYISLHTQTYIYISITNALLTLHLNVKTICEIWIKSLSSSDCMQTHCKSFYCIFFKLLNQNTTNNRKQNTFFSQSHYSTIIQLAISILQPFQIRQFDLLVHYKCTMKKGPNTMRDIDLPVHFQWA